MTKMHWPAAPQAVSLAAGEVHVWAVALDALGADWQQAAPGLAPDEQQRAARFRVERVARRFVAARLALRAILARYLDAPPSAIAFQYGALGKPELDAAQHRQPLHFNLTHSHELALVAVTQIGPLGVDVELLRPLRNAEAMARRFFAAREVEAFLSLAATQRLDGFFRCWTRKEAYLKAQGLGIGQPLDRFEVSLAPGEPARLLRVADDPHEARRWHFDELLPAEGYVGAVALRAAAPSLRAWSYV